MSRRMLIGLIVPMFVCSSLGNGILPPLPLYALHVGATRAIAGWYTSFTFFCLAAGALVSGRLGALARSRTFLVLLALPVAPLIVLMGRVSSMWQLVTVTVLTWFVAGCLGTGINITVPGTRQRRSGAGCSVSWASPSARLPSSGGSR